MASVGGRLMLGAGCWVLGAGWWPRSLGVHVTKPIRTTGCPALPTPTGPTPTGCLGQPTPTGCLGLPTGREEKVVLLEGSQGGPCRHKQTQGYSSIVKTIQTLHTIHTIHTHKEEGRGLARSSQACRLTGIIVGRMHKLLNISFLSIPIQE